MDNQLVKSEFDFGWKKWRGLIPYYANQTLKYQKGDILDIGCATCELYTFLRDNGWKKKYYGIDIQKYENYEYPQDVNLIIGDSLKIEFPEVDSITIHNVLEHVDSPLKLLKKAIEACNENVLINITKRNEELWKYHIIEYHQLDKTHKHCGFSKKEIYNIVDQAGGKINVYTEIGEINAAIGAELWDSNIPQFLINVLFKKIFTSKAYNQEIWAEIVKK